MSARALGSAAAIAEALATPDRAQERARDQWWPQSLAQGAAGITLLHIERARTSHGPWERVQEWLRATVTDGVATHVATTHLYFGAPAVLWAAHQAHTAGLDCVPVLERLDPVVLDLVQQRLEQAGARLDRDECPHIFEFDAIRGLAGLGQILLARGHRADLRLVLEYMVTLTQSRIHEGREVPGWWSHVGPGGSVSPDFPGGHANNGMAHGIGGPLALLAQAALAGVRVPGDVEAIGRILAWLDSWQQAGSAGVWWPYWVTTSQHRDAAHTRGPQRPSWCYGAAGLARAQQLAARALNDFAREKHADAALEQALTCPEALGMIVDDSLCHGWTGHAVLSAATGHGDPATLLAPVLNHQGGPRQVAEAVLAPRGPRTGIGFLEGGAGVATALHTLAATGDVSWADLFLIGGTHG